MELNLLRRSPPLPQFLVPLLINSAVGGGERDFISVISMAGGVLLFIYELSEYILNYTRDPKFFKGA